MHTSRTFNFPAFLLPSRAFPGIFSCRRGRVMLWLFCCLLSCLLQLVPEVGGYHLPQCKIHNIQKRYVSAPFIPSPECVISLILSQKREKKLFSQCVSSVSLIPCDYVGTRRNRFSEQMNPVNRGIRPEDVSSLDSQQRQPDQTITEIQFFLRSTIRYVLPPQIMNLYPFLLCRGQILSNKMVT